VEVIEELVTMLDLDAGEIYAEMVAAPVAPLPFRETQNMKGPRKAIGAKDLERICARRARLRTAATGTRTQGPLHPPARARERDASGRFARRGRHLLMQL
jgi:hypothetical protein